MTTRQSTACSRSKKSVVVVADQEDCSDYCSGFVVVKSHVDTENRGRSTLIVAPSAFVEGREGHLDVYFFDSSHLPAFVVSVHGPFCLLRTTECSSCEAIKLMGKDKFSHLTPSHVFVVVPISLSTTECLDSYMMLESLESCRKDYKKTLADSGNYLVVACDYRDKTHSGSQRSIADQNFILDVDGLDRLTSAPVFDMSGEALGIIVQDCRTHGRYSDSIKVAMKSFHFEEQLKVLLEPPQDQRGNGGGQKRKRSSPTQA